MWLMVVMPAILGFIFGAWVLYNMILDVSQRENSPFTIVGPDTIRMQVKP